MAQMAMALARIRGGQHLSSKGKRTVRLSPVIQLLTVDADEALLGSGQRCRTGLALEGSTLR